MPSSIPPDPSAPDQLTEKITAVVKEIFADPLNPILDTFKSSLPGYLEVNPPVFPVSQITGFPKYTASFGYVATQETYSSTAQGDLATVGPQIQSLADGKYLLLFGATMKVNATTATTQAVVVPNGSATTTLGTVITNNTDLTTCCTATTGSLTNGNNSILMRYNNSSSGITATYSNRFLVALKYSNL